MTSAFATMAVGMWDILSQVLVAGQGSFDVDANIKDGCASEVRVYLFPESNPPEVDPDADLVLKADAVELLDWWRTNTSCIFGRVQYADPAFHRVLVRFLGKKGIKVRSSRVEELLEEPPDPPLVAQRARYFLDRVLERYPLWRCSYNEWLIRGRDLHAGATVVPGLLAHYSVSFLPEKIMGRMQPECPSLPVSEFAVDCADPGFRKQFVASLADPRLQQVDLSGLP